MTEPDYEVMVAKLREVYASWGLELEAPPAGPKSGAVRQSGGSGLVRYAFSEDADGPYLEYYSFHRIGGDAHGRIYEDGRVQRLDSIATMHIVTGDPAEDEASLRRLQEHNRRVTREMEDAGLLSGGPVPNSFVINSALVEGVLDKENGDAEPSA